MHIMCIYIDIHWYVNVQRHTICVSVNVHTRFTHQQRKNPAGLCQALQPTLMIMEMMQVAVETLKDPCNRHKWHGYDEAISQ